MYYNSRKANIVKTHPANIFPPKTFSNHSWWVAVLQSEEAFGDAWAIVNPPDSDESPFYEAWGRGARKGVIEEIKDQKWHCTLLSLE